MQRAHWDDDVSVLSAENVFFDIETAGLAARFGAVLLDMTLQLIVVLLLSIAGLMFTTYVSPIEEWGQWMLNISQAIFYLLIFLIFYAYYFFFEWLWDGQTPGKRAMRLRVMQTNGMPITYWHALVRNVIRLADFLPMMYGVGAVVGILDSSNRRAGDLIAGTIVARERGDIASRKVLDIESAVEQFLAASLPVETVSETPNAPVHNLPVDLGSPQTIASLEQQQPQHQEPTHQSAVQTPESGADAEAAAMLRRLNAQDYELARDFLIRREKLPNAARLRLAQSLAARLSAKLQINPPSDLEAELFLNEVVTRLRGRF